MSGETAQREHAHLGPNGRRVRHAHQHGDVSHSHDFMWNGAPGRSVLVGWTYYGGPDARASRTSAGSDG